jgi:hypothetical protein
VSEQEKQAVIRLMKEIMGFTDRPDYYRPPSVKAAFETLYPALGIDETWICQNYCDIPEEQPK